MLLDEEVEELGREELVRMEAARLDAAEQPGEQRGALSESLGRIGSRLEDRLEDGERRVDGLRLVVLGVVEAGEVLHQRRRAVVLEQRVDEAQQILRRRVLGTGHLLQELERVVGDVAVLVREEAEERGHALGLDEDGVQLRHRRHRVQPFERLVQLDLRIHKALGLVGVLHAQLHVEVDLLLHVQDEPLERVRIERVHLQTLRLRLRRCQKRGCLL